MKVVTFGELMVRLQPFNYERFVQANSLEFSFGGGEANVAVSLANYGLDAAFVTKLPAHAIGQAAVNSLRRYGVDTSMITRGGDRVGIYYNEKGASQRGSVCIYDRANSAIQLAQPSDFAVTEVWEVLSQRHAGRASATQVTVFDSVGFALEDFSALRYMRDTALGLGMGERMALIPALDDPKDLFSLLRQPTLASCLQHLPEMAEA